MKRSYIYSDSAEELRNMPGFVSAAQSTYPLLEGEIGQISAIRVVGSTHDPVISNRRKEIEATRQGTAPAAPELRAECAVMRHVSNWLPGDRTCRHCGAKI